MADPREPEDTIRASDLDPVAPRIERDRPLRLPPRYEFVSVLGVGGMGQVVRVRDRELGREVALKTIRSNLGGEEVRGRFLIEARTTAQLEHPNIVPIYDVGTLPGGDLYVTMKIVEGETLARILARHRRRPTARQRHRTLSILADVARALAHAHARGVVHRDLKPENVMVGPFGETLVMDWGLARVREEPRTARASGGTSTWLRVRVESLERTMPGSIMGTLPYMAPEQVEGRIDRIDARTDVWALGVILWELLIGSRPFRGATARELASAILTVEPEPVRRLDRSVPRELAAIARKCLAKEQDERYPSAVEYAVDIERFLEGRSVAALADSWPVRLLKVARRNPVPTAAAAVVSLAAAATAVALVLSGAKVEEASSAKSAAEASERVVSEAIRDVAELERWAAGHGMAKEVEVRRRFEEVAARVPEHGFPWRSIGIWYYQNRRAGRGAEPLDPGAVRERARAALLEALLRDEEDPVSLAYLLFLALETRDLDTAGPLLDRLEATSAETEFRPFATGTRALLAARRTGDEEAAARLRDEAIFRLDEAIDRNPRLVWALHNRGAARYDRGEFDAALADFGAALAVEPDFADSLHGRGEALVPLRRYEDARRDLDAAIALDPANAAFHQTRGLAREGAGDLAGALEDHSRAIELDPGYWNAFNSRASVRVRLARALETAGRTDEARRAREEALRDYDQAIEIRPRYALALANRGTVRLDLGDAEGALADLEAALAIRPRDPEAEFARGNAQLALGQPRRAIEAYDRAIALDPRHADAFFNRGLARARADDLEGAILDYGEAHAIDPRRPDVLNSRGRARFELAQRHVTAGRQREAAAASREALADLDEALRLHPDLPEALANRGLVRFSVGNHSGAEADFARFLEVAPEHPFQSTARRYLEETRQR